MIRALTVLFFCLSTLAISRGPAFGANAKLVIRNARIMTMASSGRQDPIFGYLSVAADGTVLSVGAGEPPKTLHADQVVDAHGDFMIPGFISAHSHLWQAAYRGLAADQTLPGWIADLYGRRAAKASPEDMYWFGLLGALDHLEHGITSAYDFTYGGPGDDAELANRFEEAQFRATEASGIRFVHSYGPGLVSAHGSLDGARARLKAFLDWTQARPPSTRFLGVMLGGMAPFSDTPRQAVVEAALMKAFHLGNETHYLEAPEDQREQRAKLKWMTDSGMLGDGLIFGHFIHVDDFVLQQTAKAGAAMVWNPLSNGRLASGVPDIPKYLKMAIRVGMGVDGEASADLADPFENMRTGLYAIRDKYENASVMSPYTVLWLHTMGSADVLHIKDRLGSLEPGKLADFLLVSPRRLGVSLEDPYANLVFIATERDLDGVYVGGALVVDHGRVLSRDLDKVQAECNRRVELRR